MNEAAVYINERLAGTLKKTNTGAFIFSYDLLYYTDNSAPSISLSLPKSRRDHQSAVMFPFFAGLLAEGENRRVQEDMLNIDAEDEFILLIRTAQTDTVGAVTVRAW